MERDKARDDKFFGGSTYHEINYVVSLYDAKKEIREFLKKRYDEKVINYMSHREVYQLIEKELGYKMPN